MKLSKLPKKPGTKSGKKRVGRGYGSGKGGHTTGLGTKGQKARGSGKVPAGFEGGQSPLYKKMPKLPGFKSHTGKKIQEVQLVRLNRFEDGAKVTPESLIEIGLIKKVPRDGVKIIASGNLHKKLELSGFLFTKGARELIEKSGSKIIEKK